MEAFCRFLLLFIWAKIFQSHLLNAIFFANSHMFYRVILSSNWFLAYMTIIKHLFKSTCDFSYEFFCKFSYVLLRHTFWQLIPCIYDNYKAFVQKYMRFFLWVCILCKEHNFIRFFHFKVSIWYFMGNLLVNDVTHMSQ